MKKIILLFIVILIVFSYNNEESIEVFSYSKEEVFDNYYINFKDCNLNTNNFIEKFSYIKESDFKILKVTPYNDLKSEFLFYTDDLEYILNNLKNKYINLMMDESKYTTNICIKEIKINTSNFILDKLKNVIAFTY